MEKIGVPDTPPTGTRAVEQILDAVACSGFAFEQLSLPHLCRLGNYQQGTPMAALVDLGQGLIPPLNPENAVAPAW